MELVTLPLEIEQKLLDEVKTFLLEHPDLGFKDEFHFIDFAIIMRLHSSFADKHRKNLIISAPHP